MKKMLPLWTRVVIFISALALVGVLFMPFWRIELDAPQYPEGLVLQIYTSKIGGDVDIINGLNHYIGMKTLHAEEFIEFTILPYLTAGFAALFIFTAFRGTSGALRFTFIAFLVFGIVAMADFWKWEYDYGHNLNPDAAIKVPGMAYQPPLIGYKQLLNFGAYSIPDIGGWIFITAGVVMGSLMLYDNVQRKKEQKVLKVSSKMAGIVAVMFVAFLSSCNEQPQPITAGKENCDFCKMTIMDVKFATELITVKGKIYKFDDAHCLVSSLRSGIIDKKDVKEIYFIDYKNISKFIPANAVFLLSSEALHSPMSGNVAAFSTVAERDKLQLQIKGDTISWSNLYN
jgi:copper chaperone NosL